MNVDDQTAHTAVSLARLERKLDALRRLVTFALGLILGHFLAVHIEASSLPFKSVLEALAFGAALLLTRWYGNTADD